MKEILLFCNVERQGQMLRKAWKMAEMPEEISSGVHLFDSASALTPEMRREISEVAVVFVFWQGTIYTTDITEAIRKIREKTGGPFAFLASASIEGTCCQELTPEQMDTLRQYLQYGDKKLSQFVAVHRPGNFKGGGDGGCARAFTVERDIRSGDGAGFRFFGGVSGLSSTGRGRERGGPAFFAGKLGLAGYGLP